jgi:hypothetical protein
MIYMEEQYELFDQWIIEKRLVLIEAILEKTGRKILLGRLLHFDHRQNQLLIYDDDHKKVHCVRTNEIDHISPAD